MRFIDDATLARIKFLKSSRKNTSQDTLFEGTRLSGAGGGRSREFSDYKAYAPGDETRLIDWKVYAKKEKLFVKKFMREKSAKCVFVLDCSASMGREGGGQFPAKLEYAAGALMARAAYSLFDGDACSLCAFSGDTGHRLPFSSQLGQLLKMDSLLSQISPSGKSLPVGKFERIVSSVGKNTALFLFSDLMVDYSHLEKFARMALMKKIKMGVFQVLNASESRLPSGARTVFFDAEDENERFETDGENLREEYSAEFGKWLFFCENFLRKKGIRHFKALTSDPLERILDPFLRRMETE